MTEDQKTLTVKIHFTKGGNCVGRLSRRDMERAGVETREPVHKAAKSKGLVIEYFRWYALVNWGLPANLIEFKG